jgi:hypothetical protein
MSEHGPAGRLAVLLVLASLAGGCGVTATARPATQPATTPAGVSVPPASEALLSITPSSAASSMLTAAPLPTADGWPFTARSPVLLVPTFGPDGTAYVDVTAWPGWDASGLPIEYARLAALDAAGRMRPGWPVELGLGSVKGLAVGSDGLITILVQSGGNQAGVGGTYGLHRLDAGGREIAGWPTVSDQATDCAAPLVTADGSAYLVCQTAGGAGSMRLSAFDTQGSMRAGWPVTLASTDFRPAPRLGPDGTLYVFAMNADGSGRLHAFGPDGRDRAGWPVSTPAWTSGYLLAPDGTIRLVWYGDLVGGECTDAQTTVVSAIGADGRTLPGWPRVIDGVATSPVLDAGSTIYMASANVQSGSSGQVTVVAIGADGRTRAGWPATPAGFASDCPDLELTLALSPGGPLYLLGNLTVGGRVIALSTDGQTLPGWPYPTQYLDTGCNDCTPGGAPQAPATGTDGTAYLATGGGHGAPSTQVVALDILGRVRPGWPYPLPSSTDTEMSVRLTVGPGGDVYVALLSTPVQEVMTGDVATLIVLRPDGTPAS